MTRRHMMAASCFFLPCPEAMHSMDSGEERGDGVEVCQIEASVLIVLLRNDILPLCAKITWDGRQALIYSNSFVLPKSEALLSATVLIAASWQRRSASKLCVADPKPSKTFRRLFGYVNGEAKRATLHQSFGDLTSFRLFSTLPPSSKW